MKIVLISDSHGNKMGIDKIFQSIKFDYLFFMGDGLSALGTYIYLDNVFAVSGNCDFFSSVDNERFVEPQDKKIFMTHGHKYGVKLNLNNLIKRGQELNADFVFYGHTHNQRVDKVGEMYTINPGSFSPKPDRQSYGLILTIEEDSIQIEDLVV